MATPPMLHTTGKLAVRLGVQDWQILNLAKRNAIPSLRVGRIRVYAESDEPKIRTALIEAGYLKAA